MEPTSVPDPPAVPARSFDREFWNNRYETTELVWTAQPNLFLVAEVEGLSPGRALDLGAGEGRNAVWLARQGWRVTALDFSETGLAKARALALSAGVELDTVCEDAGDLQVYSAFDLVIVMYLHLPQERRRAVYRRAADAVAPGGTLLVVGHDATNLADGHGGPQDPAVLFSPDEVASDLVGTGLEIDRAERVLRSVATDDGERIAIDALVRARRL